VYRSPGKLPDSAAIELLSFLQSTLPSNNSPFLLAGDFNFPSIDWKTYTTNGPVNASEFLEFILNSSLTQHTTFPTRYRHGNTPSLLDLIFTDSPHNIASITSLPPLGKSDHVVILFSLKLFSTPLSHSSERFNYPKADFILINDMISSIDWTAEFDGLSAEVALSILDEFLSNILNALVPISQDSRSNKPKWLTRNVKTAINRKKRAWDHYKMNPSHHSNLLYLSARSIAATAVLNSKREFELKSY